MSKNSIKSTLLLTALLLCWMDRSEAGVWDTMDVGFRFGYPLERNDGDFWQYELYGAWRLPFSSTFRCGWRMETLLDVTLAQQDGEGDQGRKISTSGELLFHSPQGRWPLLAGLGVGVLAEEEVGDVDYAGPVFFIFNGGPSYWFSDKVSLGYRYHHESNGSIYDKNPSVNMHQLEVRISF